MATTNQANPEAALATAATGLNSKVEAALKELMSQKGGETSNSQVSIETQVVTHGNIVNATAEDVYVAEKHDWFGREGVPSFPEVIPPIEQDTATFEHRGPLPGGSKGAVVYTQGKFLRSWQWIMAFDRVCNKVYMLEGARKKEPGQIDWDWLEKKLDASIRQKWHLKPAYTTPEGQEPVSEIYTTPVLHNPV